MARKKTESMLTRQRRLLKEQRARQAARKAEQQQSSRSLPSRGNSSGNTSRSRSQRRSTAKRVQGQQQQVITSAMNKTLKQRAALDKQEQAAKGTKGSGVRTGRASSGALATRPSSALTTTNRRGRTTTTSRSSGTPTRTSRTPARTGSTGPRGMTPRVTGSTPRLTGKGGGLPPALANQLPKGLLPPKGGTGGRSGTPRARGRGRMGPLSALVEQGVSRLLNPVAKTVGYEGAKAIRGALGGGEPTRDKDGNKIKKDKSYKGPGGNPNGSGQGQAQQRPGTGPYQGYPKPTRRTTPEGPTRSSNASSGSGRGAGSSSGSTGSSSGRTRKAQNPNDMDANYRAWAKANPKLAKKVKKGQAGYEAINSKPKTPKSSQPSRTTSAAREAVKGGIRQGRAADKSIAKIVKKPKKKQSAANRAGWPGNRNY